MKNFIGVGNRLPWHYPADLKRFFRLTLLGTVIMGRRTWESLPKRPLEQRRNLVITTAPIAGVECFANLEAALADCSGEIWIIGGARLFAAAMHLADRIDLTLVPDRIEGPNAVYFPSIDGELYLAGPVVVHEDDPRLRRQLYQRH